MMTCGPEEFLQKYGSQSMNMLSAILRGMLIASPGKKLVVADFASIEARVLLWLAGDEEALEMFRQGKNLYISMSNFIFKRDDITKKDEMEYAIGKATTLGAGFGMSAPKFKISCENNGIFISDEMAAKAIKAYREKHKSVVSMWYATDKAVAKAIREPGSVQKVCGGRVAYGMDKTNTFLLCRLPSGRMLRYYRPSVQRVDGPFGEKDEIRYWTSDVTGKLGQFKTYGASCVENYVQAIARDFMVNGMLLSEAAGYENGATVHDELIAEVADADLATGKKSLTEFISLICTLPNWGDGAPIAAEGFISTRYRK